MNTETTGEPLLSPIPAASQPTARLASALRVRAHRERRRLGVRCVRIQVVKNSIEALVKMGYLPEAEARDVRAIQKAVQTYVADAPFFSGDLVGVTAFQRRPNGTQHGFSA